VSVTPPTRAQTPSPGIAQPGRLRSRWPSTPRVTTIAALFGAELIHVSVINAHFHEWIWSGLFFVAMSLVEGLLAAGLAVAPSRRLCQLTVAVSVATVAVWVMSRAAGLPAGPHSGIPEAAGTTDQIATLLEISAAATLLWSMSTSRMAKPAPMPQWRARGAAIAAVMVIGLLTGVALTSTAAGGHH
jgi:hypothetical protein